MIGASRLNTLAKGAAAPSRTAVTVTAYGNAKVSTTNPKIGTGSYAGDGSGDYLEIYPAGSAIATWNAAGGYTIEYWFKANSFTIGTSPSNYPLIAGLMNQGADICYWSFGPTSSTQITFYYYTGAQQRLNATVATMSTGTWYHIAMTYNGSSITIWKDGVSVATSSVTGTPSINTGYPFPIGQVNFVSYNGNIDEFRISKTARYTGTFTPSTAAFTNDANTTLLLHMNGTDASTSFPDDNA